MPHLLDTDSASLAFEGNERVRGALNLIQRNRDKSSFPAAHGFLVRLLDDISGYDLHPYNAEAMLVFASFPAQVRRVGSQDCRIAASAIAAGWIVTTANHRHFSQIPGVQFEDWSR